METKIEKGCKALILYGIGKGITITVGEFIDTHPKINNGGIPTKNLWEIGEFSRPIVLPEYIPPSMVINVCEEKALMRIDGYDIQDSKKEYMQRQVKVFNDFNRANKSFILKHTKGNKNA